jgi:hypothetical protein
MGLYFALVVLRMGVLHGVIACHSTANIVLYLVAPFLLAGVIPG